MVKVVARRSLGDPTGPPVFTKVADMRGDFHTSAGFLGEPDPATAPTPCPG
nr:hypothetical protein [uncultured bacterium]